MNPHNECLRQADAIVTHERFRLRDEIIALLACLVAIGLIGLALHLEPLL
jgi:hypothetical protein